MLVHVPGNVPTGADAYRFRTRLQAAPTHMTILVQEAVLDRVQVQNRYSTSPYHDAHHKTKPVYWPALLPQR
jgi:hypothetical protein